MTRPPIDLHIDNLILEGVAPGDRERVAASVRANLTRLLSERGLPGGATGAGEPAVVDCVDAGVVRVRDAGPAAVATAVARTIYGGLKR